MAALGVASRCHHRAYVRPVTRPNCCMGSARSGETPPPPPQCRLRASPTVSSDLCRVSAPGPRPASEPRTARPVVADSQLDAGARQAAGGYLPTVPEHRCARSHRRTAPPERWWQHDIRDRFRGRRSAAPRVSTLATESIGAISALLAFDGEAEHNRSEGRFRSRQEAAGGEAIQCLGIAQEKARQEEAQGSGPARCRVPRRPSRPGTTSLTGSLRSSPVIGVRKAGG